MRGSSSTTIGTVRAAGRIRDGRGLPPDRLRFLDSYAAVYVLNGTGHYADANGADVAVASGDLLLVFPGLGHTYGPAEGGVWTELYIVFDGPVFDLWRDRGLLDTTRPVWHLEPVDHWARALDEVSIGLERVDAGTGLRSVCALLTVLAEALSAPEPGASDADRQWLAEAIALLDLDSRRELPLQQIAAQLAMSYDGFRKRFRRLAGVSPARFRSLRSVDRACELIAKGQHTNRHLAADLGYCDEFHFSRRFREITGQTPSQFRASLSPG